MNLTLLLLTLAVFLTVILIMAVGVMFKRPCLRGSCGGPSVVGSDGEPLTCSTCPNRDKHRSKDSSTADGGLPVVR